MAVAAGGGSLIERAPVKGWPAFQRTWLDRHAIDRTQCTVISVGGESMEPTLPDGCSILVDRLRRRRRVDRIFVLLTENGLVVKRARKADTEEWQTGSDNPTWPATPWERDVEVIGEVRWMARTFA